MRRYRYKIFYRIVEEDTVEIMHIRHTSRQPWPEENSWQNDGMSHIQKTKQAGTRPGRFRVPRLCSLRLSSL